MALNETALRNHLNAIEVSIKLVEQLQGNCRITLKALDGIYEELCAELSAAREPFGPWKAEAEALVEAPDG